MTFPQACASCQNRTEQRGATVAPPVWRAEEANCRHVDAFNVSSREHGRQAQTGKTAVASKRRLPSPLIGQICSGFGRGRKWNSSPDKKKKSAHTHKISAKTYCASFLNAGACQSTIRHSCYNMSVMDLCSTANSASVCDGKKQLELIMGSA